MNYKFQWAEKWLPKSVAKKGLILMYHRIAELEIDPWNLSVTPQHFAEHLQVLKDVASPTKLQSLGWARNKGDIPSHAVVITFDDGYADNLYFAKPLIERYCVPATLFAISGRIGENREFWWDELEQAILGGNLPHAFDIDIDGKSERWELEKDDPHYERSPLRLSQYYSIWRRLQVLPEIQREHALESILKQVDIKPVVRPMYRPLTATELCEMEKGGFIEIGVHTVNHPNLPLWSAKRQAEEIALSKSALEGIVQHPVMAFSYPFGEYNAKTVSLVKEACIEFACTTDERPVRYHDDCLQLPRLAVFDCNGKEFKRWLLRWFKWYK